MTPLTVVHQASMSFTISWSLLRFMSIESVMLSNHLIFCPLLLLPSIFPSSRFVCLFVCFFPVSWLFTSGGQRIGAPTSASVLPMNIWGWFPLGLTGLTSLKYKGLKSLLQHHSLKASVFRDSVFFVVQLTSVAGKTIALDYADICWFSEPSAFQYAV